MSMIAQRCDELASMKTRGDLGRAIAEIVLSCSPRDLMRMKWNFSEKIRDFSPTYRRALEEAVSGHLHGTYQDVRLMSQQGRFSSMCDPVPEHSRGYWDMVVAQCRNGGRGGSTAPVPEVTSVGILHACREPTGSPCRDALPRGRQSGKH